MKFTSSFKYEIRQNNIDQIQHNNIWHEIYIFFKNKKTSDTKSNRIKDDMKSTIFLKKSNSRYEIRSNEVIWQAIQVYITSKICVSLALDEPGAGSIIIRNFKQKLA